EIEALGRAGMVVEHNARADHVDEGRALMRDRGLDDRNQLLLVAREGAGDKAGAQLERHRDEIDGIISVDDAALGLRAAVSRGRELALGEAVNTVVLDNIDHVDAATQAVRELAEAD